jgi:type II secretory pathway component GspD/PulD (secretin)
LEKRVFTVISAAIIIAGLFNFASAQISEDTSRHVPVIDESSPILTEMLNPKLKTPITLWAKDANLAEVLKVLAERSEMNFVAGESVHQGKITIILNKTPLDEAIDLLVRASGLSYEIVGNSVLIAAPGNMEKEVGQSSYVVRLKYANAREVAGMLSDITKNIKIDEGGNRLICFTSPRVIYEIEKVVRSIDHPHILVLLETRFVEVSASDENRYGIDWENLMPISTSFNYPVGPVDAGFKGKNWLQGGLDFNVTLDMLIKSGDARVLMDSKLTTTNNREASLHIGEIVPYETQSTNLAVAGGAAPQVQKEEVGIKIKMVPHINDDNQITLTMTPEVSSIIDLVGRSGMPKVSVRKTTTTVRVENGQTIFLAGLLSEEVVDVISKLPLLGDIPVIGLLFQHKRKTIMKKNLIIEIKPKIIYDTNELNFDAIIDSTDTKD